MKSLYEYPMGKHIDTTYLLIRVLRIAPLWVELDLDGLHS